MVRGDMVSNFNIINYDFVISSLLNVGPCKGGFIFLYFGGALGRGNL